MSTVENTDIHQILPACNRNHPAVGRSRHSPGGRRGRAQDYRYRDSEGRMVQRRSPLHTAAEGATDPKGKGHHGARPGSSDPAGDIHSGVPGGDRDCRRHQDLAAGRGAADHGSQDRWGRGYPVVQRRSSLHGNRAAPTHAAGEGHY